MQAADRLPLFLAGALGGQASFSPARASRAAAAPLEREIRLSRMTGRKIGSSFQAERTNDMWRYIAVFSFLGLSAVAAIAQDEPSVAVKKFVSVEEPIYEYGDASDLNGVTRVFIDTGLNKQLRDQIVEQIKKQLAMIDVVKKREDAQVFLVFSGAVRHIAGMRKERWGQGWIFSLPDNKTIRLIASFDLPKEEYLVGASPIDAFAALFVREYRKGNPTPAKPRE